MVCQPLVFALHLRPSLPQVWVEAALQIFYSLGVGFGGLLTFASYNTFHQNIYRSVQPPRPGGRSRDESGQPGKALWGEGGASLLWPGPVCLDFPGRDTFIVTLGNAITSILAGFAIFSVLGYMSQELGVPVDQVAKAGGQAGQSWGVRVCVGHSRGRLREQVCTGQVMGGFIQCAWSLGVQGQRGWEGKGVCVSLCLQARECTTLSSVLSHLSDLPCLSM